ncbi:uncharacterized protein LOC115891691 [Sitophilus oryzae]|uniref:Uncharacterized protein LOC115891691 n=1 Tax=Sitophilus oryzae TaxID=7048 RepID=A0A6J2YVF0_SITOR|nr:uncharacterized protein LOC115891691 [Sitophilus oryzae]
MGTTIISFSRFILSVSLFFFLVVGSARTVVRGEEDDGSKEELRIYKAAFEFLRECGKKEFSLCLKERALRYIDTLPNELDVGVGVKIKSNGRVSKRMQREALPDEPKARESAVENILWDRISDYLSTHVIELKMPSNTVHDMKKSVEEGRGKGGGGGGKKGGGGGEKMKGMMMMMMMKAAILGALALKAIGLLAFKALLVAKVALTISSIIALKKLLEHKHHSSTYEIVATHPHHEEVGHYDRAFTQDQLAYKGYEGAARNRF